MFKSINAIDFARSFPDNEACLGYLEKYKWKEGYCCRQCGGQQYIKGKTGYHRRCRQCGYDESVTANTLFHDIRVPLLKAFYMLFRLTTKKKGMSTVELAAEVGVQQKTAWLFKRKVQLAMRQASLLQNNVDVDEFILGGRQKGHHGRKIDKKKAALIAIEVVSPGKVGNIFITPIQNCKTNTLKDALQKGVSEKATLRTDDYQPYKPLRKEMDITQVRSLKGRNFIELHIQIMLFKSWMRGIHHRCSKELFFAYCDEYSFRFNHRNCRPAIFNKLLSRMLHLPPHPYPVLKTLSAYST